MLGERRLKTEFIRSYKPQAFVLEGRPYPVLQAVQEKKLLSTTVASGSSSPRWSVLKKPVSGPAQSVCGGDARAHLDRHDVSQAHRRVGGPRALPPESDDGESVRRKKV